MKLILKIIICLMQNTIEELTESCLEKDQLKFIKY